MKTLKNKIVYEKNINELNGKAALVVFPDSADEIANIVRSSETDIIPRGAGTSFTGACAPNNSIIIDFSKMNKLIEISPARRTAIVEPGITIRELNEKLEEFNLEFPVESIFPGIETIGGMIAKNSSGSREIKYGRIVKWIDSLEVINGKGEQIRVSKSDLSDFVGMEGSTGAIVKAYIRVTAKRNRSLSILKSDTLEGIFKANKVLRLDQYISSIDFLNREISVMLGLQDKYHLFIEFEDSRGNFKEREFTRLTNLKNDAYKAAASTGAYILESAKVFSDSLPDFMFALEERRIPYFSHLASGVVYFCFKPEDKETRQGILNLIKKLKGELSYNLGIGLLNKQNRIPEEQNTSRIIARVKERHDPQNKFNRGKFIDFEVKPAIVEEPVKEEVVEVQEVRESLKPTLETEEQVSEVQNV